MFGIWIYFFLYLFNFSFFFVFGFFILSRGRCNSGVFSKIISKNIGTHTIYLSHSHPVGISYWNKNLPHYWVWSSEVPGCPVAGSWKTPGWRTCRWRPCVPRCYRSRPSCGLQRGSETFSLGSSTLWAWGRRHTHWVPWRRRRGPWWAAVWTCQWHLLPATARNPPCPHNRAWTSVVTMLRMLSPDANKSNKSKPSLL